MLQKINLYLLLPKKKEPFLTQKKVFIYYCIFVLMLLCVYSLLTMRKNQLQKQYETVSAAANAVQGELSALKAKYPVSDPNTLKQSVHDLQLQYDDQLHAIDILSPNARYSTYLTGLAEGATTGAWLTQINFSRSDTKILLSGFALHSEIANDLLTHLLKQPKFKGLTFYLKAVKQEKLPASFDIASRRGQA